MFLFEIVEIQMLIQIPGILVEYAACIFPRSGHKFRKVAAIAGFYRDFFLLFSFLFLFPGAKHAAG